MARQSRLCLPGQPHLVVQSFRSPLPSHMLEHAVNVIGSIVSAEGLTIHAWSLGVKQAVFLLTPTKSGHLSFLVRSLMRRLVLSGHSAGALDRYRSCALSTNWVLPVQHWIERLQSDAAPSSGAGHTGEAAPEPWLRSHPSYWALGNTPFERQELWRMRLQEPLGQDMQLQIEHALRGQWWLGELSDLEALGQDVMQLIARRRVHQGRRGRPKLKNVPN